MEVPRPYAIIRTTKRLGDITIDERK